MPRNDKLVPVEHFIDILAGQKSPLIGGQAVNLWAVSFQKSHPEIRRLAPFVSRDCDLLGDLTTLIQLKSLTGADYTKTKAGSASPVVGFVTIKTDDGIDLLIEVLHTVRGLSSQEASKSVISVEFHGRVIQTFSPIILLKTKIANAAELPQKNRQDVHHLKILIPCVSAYITEAITQYNGGSLSERGLVRLLNRCYDIVVSESAKRVAAENGLILRACFPGALADLSSPKVARFYRHRAGYWLCRRNVMSRPIPRVR